jgi:hypothetical protein
MMTGLKISDCSPEYIVDFLERGMDECTPEWRAEFVERFDLVLRERGVADVIVTPREFTDRLVDLASIAWRAPRTEGIVEEIDAYVRGLRERIAELEEQVHDLGRTSDDRMGR